MRQLRVGKSGTVPRVMALISNGLELLLLLQYIQLIAKSYWFCLLSEFQISLVLASHITMSLVQSGPIQ